MIRRVLLVLIPLFGFASSARAQEEVIFGAYAVLGVSAIATLLSRGCCTDASVGSTVRFHDNRTGTRNIGGVIRSIDRDSMSVAIGDSIWRGPLLAVEGLQAQTRERKWAQGWAVGFIAGATLGTVLGAFTPTEPNDDFYITRGGLVLLGAGGGAFVGSVVGTLIGTANTGTHWQSVPRSRLSMSLLVSPRVTRVGFRMSVR